ncbi:MAG: excisionase family DNA-binding protein [Sporichthyaceae bacterium]
MTTPTTVASLPAQRRRLVLTVEEAADDLGIGRTLMYALIRDGAVESVRIGRLRRVPAEALSEYVARLRETPGGHIG